MSVPAAYLAVVIIWSTTPLGIVWSSESVHPTMAVLLRMVIAVVLGWLILVMARIQLPWHRSAVKIYLYSSIGIVGGMLCSYMAAQYLASGLMSLIFGLSPIMSGLIGQKLLGEAKFGSTKRIAMTVAILGLGIVCSENISIGSESLPGIVLILSGVLFFSLSGVMIKSVDVYVHPIAKTVGALALSVPMFALAWWILDGTVPIDTWETKSLLAIVYLGLFASLIGFIAYFYVLQKMAASTVALVTMLTPIFALALGSYFNNEPITVNIIAGAVLVLAGLAIYNWGDMAVIKVKNRKVKTA